MQRPLISIVILEPELIEICYEYHVHKLAVFGSVLRNDFRDDSDIDVLVEFERGAGIGLFEFVGLKNDLSDLLGREVDLVTKVGLHKLIREAVLDSAQVVYAAGEGFCVPTVLDPDQMRAIASIDRDLLRLHSAAESCASIAEFVAGIDPGSFQLDDLRRSAILLELSRLGEAVKRLSPALKQRHGDATWQVVIDAGADGVEKYWDIDREWMWTVATTVVPSLHEQIDTILAEKSSPEATSR